MDNKREIMKEGYRLITYRLPNFGQKVETLVPIGAFTHHIFNTPHAFPQGVWFILASEGGVSEVLDFLKIQGAEALRKITEVEREKQIALASKTTSEILRGQEKEKIVEEEMKIQKKIASSRPFLPEEFRRRFE